MLPSARTVKRAGIQLQGIIELLEKQKYPIDMVVPLANVVFKLKEQQSELGVLLCRLKEKKAE
jgi:hypothetical protein